VRENNLKEINGVKVANNAIDWNGHEVGRIKIKSLVGKHPTRRTLLWLVECSCGNITEVSSAELSANDTQSCGCLHRERIAVTNKAFADKYTTHGMSGSIEQKAWKRIKSRCTNPNSEEYAVYSIIGISKAFAQDFVNFYKDIGPAPDNFNGRISVDRIDNTKGYVEGNVRWATDEMQARNKGMYANNKSGVTGVYIHTAKNGNQAWAASWYEPGRKQRTKYFSIKKYGDELAFFAACELRTLMIERLNMQGAGYTENHGKEKENN
jgi:hypothetical protein